MFHKVTSDLFIILTGIFSGSSLDAFAFQVQRDGKEAKDIISYIFVYY